MPGLHGCQSSRPHGRNDVTAIELSTEAKTLVYRGHVEDGVIRLEDAPELPEGVKVEVHLLAEGPFEEEDENIPSLYERLKDIVGKAEGLPPDLAENHDHYLHGRAEQ